MALRSLSTKIWSPAASALRRRPGPVMPPASRSRFLRTIPSQVGQHSNGSPDAAHPLRSMDDQLLNEELRKIGKVLSERNKEMEQLYGEFKRIAKWYAYTLVGVPLLAWLVEI